MTLKILPGAEQRFDEMADFISTHNPKGEHHIGYFGVTPEDTRQSIRSLDVPFDQGFRLAYDDGLLIGVMGIDADAEIGRAWLYGPVVDASADASAAVDESWAAVADVLYEAVGAAVPAGITEHEMFVDADNTHCRAFAERHGFKTHGEWAIYFMTPDRLALLPEGAADEWDERFSEQFAALHESLFPRSNYTLPYMMAEVAKGAVLCILSDGDELAGYFFGRTEPESGEAYVDLVGVADAYRRRGLGRRLMLAGLARLREMPELRQVNLTVSGGNDAAMLLYDSLGFERERDMVAFRKTVEN